MSTMAEKSMRKQTLFSLQMKMKLLNAVGEKGGGKEKSAEFGIANSTLSTIIKNRHHITLMFERGMFKPEIKRILRTAKHEDLETA